MHENIYLEGSSLYILYWKAEIWKYPLGIWKTGKISQRSLIRVYEKYINIAAFGKMIKITCYISFYENRVLKEKELSYTRSGVIWIEEKGCRMQFAVYAPPLSRFFAPPTLQKINDMV